MLRQTQAVIGPTIGKHDVIQKTGNKIHNVLQRCQSRTKPRPQSTCVENSVTLGCVISGICVWTRRKTDRHRHTHKLLQYCAPLPSNNQVLNAYTGNKPSKNVCKRTRKVPQVKSLRFVTYFQNNFLTRLWSRFPGSTRLLTAFCRHRTFLLMFVTLLR